MNQQNSCHQSNGYSSCYNFRGRDQHQGGDVTGGFSGGSAGGSVGGWSNPVGTTQPGTLFSLYHLLKVYKLSFFSIDFIFTKLYQINAS